MTKRILLAAGCVLVLAAVASAQAGGASSDLVTGSWGMDGLPYLELKYDGKGAVSGTTVWRHDKEEQRAPIAEGTFDAQTGSLKLTGELKGPDGRPRQFRIEGKIERDVVAGTYDVGGERGDFKFTRL